MHPLLLTLALAAPPSTPSSPASLVSSAGPDLLEALPADTTVVVRCEDLARFRRRLEGNVWSQFLASDAGRPWREMGREILDDALRGGEVGRDEVEGLFEAATTLSGEVVCFARPPLEFGVLVETGGRTAAVREALDPLIAAFGKELEAEVREEGQVTYELFAHPGARWERPGASPPEAGGRTPLGGGEPAPAAQEAGALVLLRTPGHLAALFGLVPDETFARARELAARLGGAAGGGSLRARYLAARSAAGVPVGGIEMFVDFSALASRAMSELAQADSVLEVDPLEAIGIDQGAWLFAGLDLQPGQRLDSGLRLELPAGGFAAKLLGTFQPLPSDLLSRVAGPAWNVSAVHWDFMEALRLVRAKIVEVQGEDARDWVAEGLEAGSQFTGVDLVEDLFGQFTGLIVAYHGLPEDGLSGEFEDDFATGVWTFGVRDMARLQSAFEKVLESLGVLDELALEEIDGSDVLVAPEEAGDVRPGIAFTPKGLVLAIDRPWLERAVRTIGGDPSAGGLLDDPRFRAAFDENLGAVAFGATDLGPLTAASRSLSRFAADRRARAEEPTAAPANPFAGLLIWGVRTDSHGLSLRAYTR